jgi:hypothetical protein
LPEEKGTFVDPGAVLEEKGTFVDSGAVPEEKGTSVDSGAVPEEKGTFVDSGAVPEEKGTFVVDDTGPGVGVTGGGAEVGLTGVGAGLDLVAQTNRQEPKDSPVVFEQAPLANVIEPSKVKQFGSEYT